jgi:hypothetical protein
MASFIKCGIYALSKNMVKGNIVDRLPLYLRPENENKRTHSVCHTTL